MTTSTFYLYSILPSDKGVDIISKDQKGNLKLHHIFFRPFCFVASGDDIDETCQTISETLGIDLSIKPEMRIPFIGFTNKKKDTLLRVTFDSTRDFYRHRKTLEENFTTYHTRTSIPAQVLAVTGLTYYGGFSCLTSQRPNITDIKVTSETGNTPPPSSKLFLRIRCVSRDAIFDQHYMYHPDPRNACDRVTAVHLRYVHGENNAAHTLTLVPFTKDSTVCQSERELLDSVSSLIRQYDPDVIFTFPDFVDPLVYLYLRAQVLGFQGFGEIERGTSKHRRASIFPRQPTPDTPLHEFRVTLQTRCVFNMVKFFQKKAFIPVESYDLYTINSNKAFRKKPCSADATPSQYYDFHNKDFVHDPDKMITRLVKEGSHMVDLERDSAMLLELQSISTISNTPLNQVVSRGEQVRVMNKLQHHVYQHGYYINKEGLNMKPLRFSVASRPPTLADPGLHPICTKLQNQCIAKLKVHKAEHKGGPTFTKKGRRKRARQQTLMGGFGTTRNTEEESQLEGGSVLKPSPAFWGESTIGVYDFQSLYPSIMRAYNISYENLVNDPTYLDLPDVKYLTIQINAAECIVVAQQKGLIPNLLAQLLQARKDVKAAMKKSKNPFERARLDKRQLSIKVVCNSVYGFCGASPDRALLAVREVMFAVTSIGRYLQKACSWYLADRYNIPTIYGDTDSIFVLLTLSTDQATLQSTIEEAHQRFGLNTSPKELNDRFPCIATLDPIAAQRAVLYLLSDKFCQECSDLFPAPIILEFENLATQCLMFPQKKSYAYQFFDPSNIKTFKKIKVTGLPQIRRENPPFVRAILKGVTTRICTHSTNTLFDFLKTELGRLVADQIPTDEYFVTKSFHENTYYKTINSAHTCLAVQLQENHRTEFKNVRIRFVIVEGNQPLRHRGRTKLTDREKLDRLYYFEQTLEKPLRKMLLYHMTPNINYLMQKTRSILANKKSRKL